MKRLALLGLMATSFFYASAQLTLGYCNEDNPTGSLSNSNTAAHHNDVDIV